jgi:hypothetical protein
MPLLIEEFRAGQECSENDVVVVGYPQDLDLRSTEWRLEADHGGKGGKQDYGRRFTTTAGINRPAVSLAIFLETYPLYRPAEFDYEGSMVLLPEEISSLCERCQFVTAWEFYEVGSPPQYRLSLESCSNCPHPLTA